MKRLALTVATLAVLFGSISAQAVGPYEHTYASKKNGGPFPTFDCSSLNPCSSLQDAINNTSAASLVTITDGEFDEGITITQAISIEAAGPDSLLRGPNNGTAITINAGNADTDFVNLTGLKIIGLNAGGTGIVFNSGRGVYLRNVALFNFSGNPGIGINFAPNSSVGKPVQLDIKNSDIENNANGNVLIKPSNSVDVAVKFNSVTIRNGNYGARADDSAGSGTVRVDATNTDVLNHKNNGFLVAGPGANPVHFMIDHSTAQNNGAYGAVATGSQAFMILSNSTIVSNVTGVAQLSGSTVAMSGNSVVNFNATNITGTITSNGLH